MVSECGASQRRALGNFQTTVQSNALLGRPWKRNGSKLFTQLFCNYAISYLSAKGLTAVEKLRKNVLASTK